MATLLEKYPFSFALSCPLIGFEFGWFCGCFWLVGWLGGGDDGVFF